VIGADVVWDQEVVGSGVTVAVVDTGMSKHRGLIRNIRGRLTGRLLAWVDFVDGHKIPFDPNGHGTHVTGIIANSQVGADGEWNGVAPGVRLVAVRVLDKYGQGTYEDVIQGIQWVVAHKDRYRIRVMNLSLVSHVQSPYWADPLNQAVMRAWAEGITVVVAAGNEGPGSMTIGVPGNNPYVITVGAFTDNYTPDDWGDDYVAPFSAAGPTLDGFVKPDVVAPGAHIISTMLPGSYLARMHIANRETNQYFSMAGTSQAAAVVSGLAALVIDRYPELTPDMVKFRIGATSFPWVDMDTTDALYSMWQQGAGRVNAPDAVFANLQGQANTDMDIWADLGGDLHYEGFSFFDPTTNQFRLRGDFYSWEGGYGAWSGGYGAWSGGYGVWSEGYGAWSGSYGVWSDGYGAWSGGYGAWSGGYGAWSGGYGAWSGGYGAWSGGYGAWSGSEPWAGSIYSDPLFIANFISGIGPDALSTITSISDWVNEP
jgi:serine protease AprX